jgi:predicted nucleic acid-binding protein
MTLPSSCQIAILDTCVLAPMPLCDTLLRLAEEPAFYIPKWSPDILRELRSTLGRMGYTAAQVQRRITAMESAFEDALVTGYEDLVEAMRNDPKDRHVLAAAVRCGADAIITGNARHFHPDAVKPYGLDVLTPDDFLVQQYDRNKGLVIQKLAVQAAARNIALEALLDRLQRFAPNCVDLIRANR